MCEAVLDLQAVIRQRSRQVPSLEEGSRVDDNDSELGPTIKCVDKSLLNYPAFRVSQDYVTVVNPLSCARRDHLVGQCDLFSDKIVDGSTELELSFRFWSVDICI